MGPHDLVEILIRTGRPARNLIEASVHLPRRGSRWVATFRDGTGRQVWRSTGLRDRKPALTQAQEWENEAKRKRAAQDGLPRKPTSRVRSGSSERELGLLTQREVALILRISERSVRAIEKRAFDKLRRHPALRDFWREHESGEVTEATFQEASAWELSSAEIIAVYALAQIPAERQALTKLLALSGSWFSASKGATLISPPDEPAKAPSTRSLKQRRSCRASLSNQPLTNPPTGSKPEGRARRRALL